MLGVQSDSGKATLGPTATALVTVDGLSTNALIDTGSPCTIASLDLAMEIMNLSRRQVRDLREWKKAAMKWLESPTIPLNCHEIWKEECSPHHAVTGVV